MTWHFNRFQRHRHHHKPTGGVVRDEEAVGSNPATPTRDIQAIRDHAKELTGFVRDGMPAMMQQMMGPGGMMRPR